jgi:hypothetical protein
VKIIFGILGLLLMVTILAVTGCVKSAPSIAPLTAKDIFNQSSENMQAVNSFHFVLDQVGGGTPITMGIEMIKAEGDVVRPDKLQTTIGGSAMGMSIEVKLVTVSGKTLMTNPLTGGWEALSDQFQVLSVFDPGTGIPAIIKGISNPTSLSNEQLGDILCYHLKGNVASEALRPLTGSSTAGVIINTEVWIGQKDFLVRQIKITGKITDSEKEGIVRTLTLTNYNQNANITLPK